MIVLDLSILNQKGTPMFNSDTFANRPAFGIVGRIFISIDTAAIYRDTGTAWDLIADGGSASTNIYNSNGTLSANRVVSDGGFGLSFTPTTHIGSAAIGGGGNGKLIVGSSTADNGIQVFGANAPSIRIDNAQSGGTQRFVFGLATATNNFIQGATAGEFCISTQSAGNMLFGMWQTTNASEVMRITTTNNLLIGSSVDGGQRLQVAGKVNSTGYFLNGMTAGSGALYWSSDRVTLANYNVGGTLAFEVNGGTTAAALASTGNLLVGTTTDSGYKLDVNGTGRFSGALTGTSATFSSSVTATSGIFSALTSINIGVQGGDVLKVDKLTGGNIAFYANSVYSGSIDATTSGSLNLASRGTYPAITILTGGNVGIGTASPSASAILDVTSTTKGFLPPRLTTTQKNAIGTPAAGLMVFDTTLSKLCVYSGTAWETITSI